MALRPRLGGSSPEDWHAAREVLNSAIPLSSLAKGSVRVARLRAPRLPHLRSLSSPFFLSPTFRSTPTPPPSPCRSPIPRLLPMLSSFPSLSLHPFLPSFSLYLPLSVCRFHLSELRSISPASLLLPSGPRHLHPLFLSPSRRLAAVGAGLFFLPFQTDPLFASTAPSRFFSHLLSSFGFLRLSNRLSSHECSLARQPPSVHLSSDISSVPARSTRPLLAMSPTLPFLGVDGAPRWPRGSLARLLARGVALSVASVFFLFLLLHLSASLCFVCILRRFRCTNLSLFSPAFVFSLSLSLFRRMHFHASRLSAASTRLLCSANQTPHRSGPLRLPVPLRFRLARSPTALPCPPLATSVPEPRGRQIASGQ